MSPSPLYLTPLTRQEAHPGLTAAYIVAVTLFVIVCLTCGVYRNHRQERFSFRAEALLRQDEAETPRVLPSALRVLTLDVPRHLLEASCPVCLEPLTKFPVSAGRCMHPLHAACLAEWLVRDRHLSCPVCRQAFEVVVKPNMAVRGVNGAEEEGEEGGEGEEGEEGEEREEGVEGEEREGRADVVSVVWGDLEQVERRDVAEEGQDEVHGENGTCDEVHAGSITAGETDGATKKEVAEVNVCEEDNLCTCSTEAAATATASASKKETTEDNNVNVVLHELEQVEGRDVVEEVHAGSMTARETEGTTKKEVTEVNVCGEDNLCTPSTEVAATASASKKEMAEDNFVSREAGLQACHHHAAATACNASQSENGSSNQAD